MAPIFLLFHVCLDFHLVSLKALGSGMVLDVLGCTWRVWEGIGGFRRVWTSGRVWEDPGKSKRVQEGLEQGSRRFLRSERVREGPGGSILSRRV